MTARAAGFSQRELCEYCGWDYKTVATKAKAKGLSTHAYLQQHTGWILVRERYYPPNQSFLDHENPISQN
ncbi:MAG: hypothetical protein AAFY63_11795 [Cyanobacteria bacterium J06643_13]